MRAGVRIRRLLPMAWLAAATPAVAQELPAPARVVAKLYRESAADTAHRPAVRTLGVLDRSPAEMAEYLDSSLVALVMEDRRCVARTNGVCNLGFAPLWDSQDPTGASVRIVPGDDSTQVRVEVRHRHDRRASRLTYVMVPRHGGWRVLDIEYEGRESLRSLLQRPTRRQR